MINLMVLKLLWVPNLAQALHQVIREDDAQYCDIPDFFQLCLQLAELYKCLKMNV